MRVVSRGVRGFNVDFEIRPGEGSQLREAL